MYRTDFWTLWEKARLGCFKRTASKHVYYLGWNRSPAQVRCMRQALGPGALGRARGIRSRGRWEGGSGWGIHVNPWLIHVNIWQKPLQYCKVISLQLIKINEKKNQVTFTSSIWPSLPIWIHSFIDFPLARKELHTAYLWKGWHGRKVLNWISWNLGFSSATKKQVIQLLEPQFCKEKYFFFF